MRDDFIRLDRDKKIVLYTKNLKQGQTYYARFKVDKKELANNASYIWESMKTLDLETAKENARNRFAELSVLQNNNMVINGKTVEQGIIDYIKTYKSRLDDGWSDYSIYMLRIYRKHVEKYWIPYIGSKKLAHVKEADFRNYESWRRSYWKKVKPDHGNVKQDPARRTIQIEINSMKAILRWCRSEGYYSGDPINYQYKIDKKTKRSTFSRQQYKRITMFLRTNEWPYSTVLPKEL
jgi:hypothetical protein